MIGAPFFSTETATSNPDCIAAGADAASLDNCEGAIAFLPASTTQQPAAPSCIQAGVDVGARLGSSLRGLGPVPGASAAARVAVGAPGFDAQRGKVLVLDLTSPCTVATAKTFVGDSVGERLGAALGQ